MASHDEHDDELVTRSSAMVIHWLRQNLKAEIRKALQEIYWQLWRELFEYLYRANWFRLIVGILTLASALTLWVKDNK